MMIRFGERVTLTDGTVATLRDFHETAGAFLQFDRPVQTVVRHTGELLGMSDRAWVRAPGYAVARERDGCKIGMVAAT